MRTGRNRGHKNWIVWRNFINCSPVFCLLFYFCCSRFISEFKFLLAYLCFLCRLSSRSTHCCGYGSCQEVSSRKGTGSFADLCNSALCQISSDCFTSIG